MNSQKRCWNSTSILSALLVLSFSSSAFAETSKFWDKFGATLGTSLEIGQLGSSGMDLKDRTLTAVAVEGFAGYRLNSKWLLGVDLNYRVQSQLTSISDADGTNLKGKGWLLGLGAQYRLNEKWAIQGAVDFLGKYNFDKQTAGGEDDHVHAPLSLRLKGQYFFRPRWTADASVNYIRWSKFHVGGTDSSETSSQWMVGVGITYHFGNNPGEAPKAVAVKETVVPAVAKREAQREEIAKVLETEKTETGYKVKLSSAAFASSKATLSPDFKSKLLEVGATLAKTPDQKITIKGHTDSSGRIASNDKLSQDRADNVKSALIEAGVLAENVEAVGLGSREPIADNKTVEGRALNRRVEILVGQ